MDVVRNMNQKKGFTLVELLAVLVVLAIVITVASSSVYRLVNRAKADTASEMRNSLKEAALNYVMGNIHLDKCPPVDANKEYTESEINNLPSSCKKEIKASVLVESNDFEDSRGFCYPKNGNGEEAVVIVYRFSDKNGNSEYKAFVNEKYCTNG